MLKILARRSILLFAIVLLQLLLSSCGNSMAPANGQGRSVGSGGTGGATPVAFMYGASNTITGLSINSDNSFTAISNSTFTLPNGAAAVSIAAVLNHFVYVIDGVGTIAGFSITRPSGALSSLTITLPQLPAGAEFAADPAGRFLFAATSTSLITFTINSSTGALTQTSSASLPIASASSLGMGVDSQGKLLVVSNGNQVVSLNISTAGVLTAKTPVASPLLRFAIDSQSKFLYGVDTVSANIYGLAIASDGSLSALTGFPFQTSAVNRSVIVRPGTPFVYVGEPNDIAGFQENTATGALTPIVQNPALTNQVNADSLAFDPSAKFLFANTTTASVLTDEKLTGVLTLNPNHVSGIAALLNAIISAAD
jgi:hypothetical protein